MRFTTRVFCAMMLITSLATASLGAVLYVLFRDDIKLKYFEKYRSITENMSNTLNKYEVLVDTLGTNAAYVLREEDKASGGLSEEALKRLVEKTGVSAMYVFDKDGRPLTWTVGAAEADTMRLFDLSPEYAALLHDPDKVVITPFTPSMHQVPTKFVSVGSADGQRILEVGLYADHIQRMLQKALEDEAAVLAVGFYTPAGDDLAQLASAPLEHHPFQFPEGVDYVQEELSDRTRFHLRVPTTVKDCVSCVTKGQAATPDGYYYHLQIDLSLLPLLEFFSLMRLVAVIGIFAIALLTTLVAWLVSRKMLGGLRTIGDAAAAIRTSGDLSIQIPDSGRRDEIGQLTALFNDMTRSIAQTQDQLVDAEKARSVSELAARVVHDIRLPLSALEVVMEELDAPTADTRRLARNAITQIAGIADELLAHRRRLLDDAAPLMVGPAIEAVVAAARARLGSGSCIQIDCVDSAASYGFFVAAPLAQFKAVIGNLLNNAIEAIDGVGQVRVQVDSCDDVCSVTVRDTGREIPDHVLVKLGTSEVTHGKTGGNGLGVYNAAKMISSWGGKLTFKCKQGGGTSARVDLPRTNKQV